MLLTWVIPSLKDNVSLNLGNNVPSNPTLLSRIPPNMASTISTAANTLISMVQADMSEAAKTDLRGFWRQQTAKYKPIYYQTTGISKAAGCLTGMATNTGLAVLLTWACWNLVSTSPISQSNASFESLNSSMTRLEQNVDRMRTFIKMVAFSFAWILSLSSPGTTVRRRHNCFTSAKTKVNFLTPKTVNNTVNVKKWVTQWDLGKFSRDLVEYAV